MITINLNFDGCVEANIITSIFKSADISIKFSFPKLSLKIIAKVQIIEVNHFFFANNSLPSLTCKKICTMIITISTSKNPHS